MDHPYKVIAPHQHWIRGVARVVRSDMDPVVSFKFKLDPKDKVATSGSCFAQHISRHLNKNGFTYFVTEPKHPIMSDLVAREFNYGTFSARYGNVYTSRQLVQLFDRAFGEFLPAEPAWRNENGAYVDPFRPSIQPNGYVSLEHLNSDREVHLSAVRNLLTNLDYFVFTLGLTEFWAATDDSAFPVCPGVSGGEFDPNKYQFKNLKFEEVRRDMEAFIARLQRVNPSARIILTVSPVPLMATIEPRHVLISTTASKAILRAVCEELIAAHPNTAYFPSYEIITGNYTGSAYFGPDLRSVTEEGVEHVMRLFLRHATNAGRDSRVAEEPSEDEGGMLERMNEIAEAICDEDALRYV
jgi:hypothetical protein